MSESFDVEVVERLDREATPGPWIEQYHVGGAYDTWSAIYRRHESGVPMPGQIARTLNSVKKDATLIVYLRNHVPGLVAELKLLRELKDAFLALPPGSITIRHEAPLAEDASDLGAGMRAFRALQACRAAREGGET